MSNKNPPNYRKNAIATAIGWADPYTGEQLVSVRGLSAPQPFKPNSKVGNPWIKPRPPRGQTDDGGDDDTPTIPVRPPIPGVAAGATRWSFETMHEDWPLRNQNNEPVDQSSIVDAEYSDNGKALRIFTKSGTVDRMKRISALRYGKGRYTWRAYISDLEGQCSIGSWLYNDDLHEIDFEVAHGKASERARLGTKPDEVIAYMTSQDGPYYQAAVNIKRDAWHTFEIDLNLTKNTEDAWVYVPTWYIDGVKVGEIAMMDFGQSKPFHIYCSVENLAFTGDALPTKNNYGLWDYVEYMPYDGSITPVLPPVE